MRKLFLLALLFVGSAHATDLKPVEKFVNSFYDCGRITKVEKTQWTEHKTGLITHCSNSKRYVILRAGPNRHQVIPVTADPLTPEQQQAKQRFRDSLVEPAHAYLVEKGYYK